MHSSRETAATPSCWVVHPDGEAWGADRGRSVGASELGHVLGYTAEGAWPTWARKVGMAAPLEPEVWMVRGLQAERMVLGIYAEEALPLERGVELQLIAARHVTARRPDAPLVHSSPDGAVMAWTDEGWQQLGGVDAKYLSKKVVRQSFGAPGTDDVPWPYFWQCLVSAWIHGAAWWDLAVLCKDDLSFATWRVRADDATAAWAAEQASGWWERHVVGRVPPAAGTGPRFSKAAHAVRLDPATPDSAATAEDFLLLDELRKASAVEKEAKAEAERLRATLRARLGRAARLVVPMGAGRGKDRALAGTEAHPPKKTVALEEVVADLCGELRRRGVPEAELVALLLDSRQRATRTSETSAGSAVLVSEPAAWERALRAFVRERPEESHKVAGLLQAARTELSAAASRGARAPNPLHRRRPSQGHRQDGS